MSSPFRTLQIKSFIGPTDRRPDRLPPRLRGRGAPFHLRFCALGVTNTPDPLYFTVWPCINSTRLLVLVSVESVHLPFLEVQSGYQLIPNLQKRQMDSSTETSTSSRVELMHGQTVKYSGSGVFKTPSLCFNAFNLSSPRPSPYRLPYTDKDPARTGTCIVCGAARLAPA